MSKKNLRLTKQFLEEEYLIKNRPTRDLAKELSVTNHAIIYYFKKFNIPRKGIGGKHDGKRLNIKREKIGKLQPIRVLEHKDKKNQQLWECLCDCGNKVVVPATRLINKKRKLNSCGCYRSDDAKKRFWKGFGEISLSYWHRTQNGAKQRNLEFSITIEYAWELFLKQERKCALSGVDLIMPKCYCSNIGGNFASLDRIDSSKGYLIGNVQWIDKDINRIKMNMDENRFINLCAKIAHYRGNL